MKHFIIKGKITMHISNFDASNCSYTKISDNNSKNLIELVVSPNGDKFVLNNFNDQFNGHGDVLIPMISTETYNDSGELIYCFS